MPAFTSRLNLYKPGDGVNISPDEAASIDKLNDNADIIDGAVGAKVVTSGTRPSSPYDGQVIFETDTGDLRVRSGSTWAMANRSDRATWNAADLTALAALSSVGIVKDGDLCTVQEGSVLYARIAGVWVQQTTATFATTAARDTAYAKASAAYRVAGAVSRIATDLFDRQYAGTKWLPVGGNLPILPTSVAGTGVTLDSATGLVTFTAATAAVGVSLNGVFTDDFTLYRIFADIPTTSVAGGVPLWLRKAGVLSVAGYDRLVSTSAGGAAAPVDATNINQASWPIAAATTNVHTLDILLLRPGVATKTQGSFEVNGTTDPPTAAGAFARAEGQLWHRTADIYDGFTIAPSTGTFTGTVGVQGVR